MRFSKPFSGSNVLIFLLFVIFENKKTKKQKWGLLGFSEKMKGK
jgi:hypothetical protein